MKKKNLKVSALEHEISTNVDEVLEILEKLNFVEHSNFWVDSNAYCWLDGEPSEAHMDKVLEKLGYKI